MTIFYSLAKFHEQVIYHLKDIQKCTYYDVPTLELNGMVNNCEQLFLLTVGSVNIFAYSFQKKLPLAYHSSDTFINFYGH